MKKNQNPNEYYGKFFNKEIGKSLNVDSEKLVYSDPPLSIIDYDESEKIKAVFNMAKEALMNDYMYMGTCLLDGFEYLMFKHIETREYIKIPKRG